MPSKATFSKAPVVSQSGPAGGSSTCGSRVGVGGVAARTATISEATARASNPAMGSSELMASGGGELEEVQEEGRGNRSGASSAVTSSGPGVSSRSVGESGRVLRLHACSCGGQTAVDSGGLSGAAEVHAGYPSASLTSSGLASECTRGTG